VSAARERRENLWALDLTVLSWRRTTFQVALGALAVARMLETRFGWWVLTAAVVGVLLTLAVHASVTAYVSAIDAEGNLVRRPAAVGHVLVRQVAVAAVTAAVAAGGLVWIALQV
jgi:hypothetical protein